jgi:hypothetical protein
MSYTKLDNAILDSSIWLEDSDTCKLWITLLAMADANGMVWATSPGISGRSHVPLDKTRTALNIFLSPDPDSKSSKNEGRRIARVEGGYLILNYEDYRIKDHTNAARQQRFREKKKELSKSNENKEIYNVTNVTSNAPVTPLSASAYASKDITNNKEEDKEKIKKEEEKKNNIIQHECFEKFYMAYPRKQKKPDAEKAFIQIGGNKELLVKMLEAISWQEKTDQWSNVEFIPLPATWLRAHQWEDEKFTSFNKGKVIGVKANSATDSPFDIAKDNERRARHAQRDKEKLALKESFPVIPVDGQVVPQKDEIF